MSFDKLLSVGLTSLIYKIVTHSFVPQVFNTSHSSRCWGYISEENNEDLFVQLAF